MKKMKPSTFLKRLRQYDLHCGISYEGRLMLGGPEVVVKQAREALNLYPGLEAGVLLALATLPEFPGRDALADMLEERAAIAECDLEEAARLLTLGPQPEDVYMGGDSNETH